MLNWEQTVSIRKSSSKDMGLQLTPEGWVGDGILGTGTIKYRKDLDIQPAGRHA